MAETKPKKEEAVEAVESNVASDKPKVSWEDKKVVVRLFLDSEKYKDDVTVVSVRVGGYRERPHAGHKNSPVYSERS